MVTGGSSIWKVSSKSKKSQTKNLYSQNKRDLAFLPMAFMIFLLIAFGGLGFWFVRQQAGVSASTPANTSIDLASQLNTESEDTTQQQNSQNEPEINKEMPKAISIKVDGSRECIIELGKENNFNLADGLNNYDSGLWIPDGDCNETDLQGIQILRINEAEIELVTSKLPVGSLFKLDPQNDIYAVIYSKSQVSASFNLLKYSKYLIEPIFDDIMYLSPNQIVDTKYLDNYTYYLEGECVLSSIHSCKVWRVNNFTGFTELIAIDFIEKVTNVLGKDKSTLVDQIRFAKSQDINNGINFIAVHNKGQYPAYELFTLDLKQLDIIQNFTVYPAQDKYFDYFR
ncbi:MAG: hypothetical protein AAGF07_02285 [Patescibacteria group bacterium]